MPIKPSATSITELMFNPIVGYCILETERYEIMRGEVISYFDMCQQEGTSLQRGMNFRLHNRHSVVLMSLRDNAPYRDRIEENGQVLIYEGHDEPRRAGQPDPKTVDQPLRLPSGGITENGKFYKAAKRFHEHGGSPDLVRVYEKIKAGIWTDNGYFHLVDAWIEQDDSSRKVCKFRLVAVDGAVPDDWAEDKAGDDRQHSRIIPASVKLAVWKRDGGKCIQCGATNELHFDHILPYSKGGTSLTTENVQLLCARHNLAKRDKIG